MVVLLSIIIELVALTHMSNFVIPMEIIGYSGGGGGGDAEFCS